MSVPTDPPAMVVTDLDGTLLDSRSRLSDGNRRALEALGAAGVVRVIATGRSLHSARSVLERDFPVDYLVFSTGIGVLDWPEDALLDRHGMSDGQVGRAVEVLEHLELDYMIHHAVPDNHRFHFRRRTASNPDFERRRDRYRGFDTPWDGRAPLGVAVSQLLAIEASAASGAYRRVRDALDDLSVVLATSPLDHASRWIEIFPPQVSKSQTSERLRERLGVPLERVAAVGNDYNDTDMLEWAGSAFVVGNAVAELRAAHEVVASNDADGFAQAAARAMAALDR